MIGGLNPFSIKTIPPANIEKYKQEILKENALAVAAGTEEAISTSDEYVNPVKNTVAHPVEKTISKPVVAAVPVVKQVTENHYHFEALLTVSKYIGVSILAIFAFFSSIKSILLLKKYFTVRSATKNSKQILDKFDNEFEENKNYLAFIRKISDQVLVNSVLIDNRKNKETVLNLIVTNENLKDKLNFLESNFVKTMK